MSNFDQLIYHSVVVVKVMIVLDIVSLKQSKISSSSGQVES